MKLNMDFESNLIQYYINKHDDIKEYYFIHERLEQYHIDLILKNMNADIATVFRQNGHQNKADLIFGCNSLKYLKQCLAHEEHKDFMSSFCRDRYCPICSHIKSHKQTQMLHELFNSMRKDNNYKNCYLIFVTLTQKNVVSDELKEEVNKIGKALSKLMKTEPLFKSFKEKEKNSKGNIVIKNNKPLCIGTIRKLECTSKFQNNRIEHNPHVHMLLLVRKDYWNRKSKQWTHKKLQKIWRKYMELDYDPVVHITLVKEKELRCIDEDLASEHVDINSKEAKKSNLSNLDPSGALKEIGKYEGKDSDKLQIYKDENGELQINWKDARIILNDLYGAFNRKQTLVYTGEFRKQKQRLFGNKEVDDLLNEANDDEIIDIFKNQLCRKCNSPTTSSLLRYSGKTGAYYSLSDSMKKSYENGINKLINEKKRKKKI